MSNDFKYYMYLHVNARQPGKVLLVNGLHVNEWQSEIFTEFLLKDSVKLFDGL